MRNFRLRIEPTTTGDTSHVFPALNYIVFFSMEKFRLSNIT